MPFYSSKLWPSLQGLHHLETAVGALVKVNIVMNINLSIFCYRQNTYTFYTCVPVGSNHSRRASLHITDKARCSWSDREKAALIHVFKELVATGWKSDNGFRGGYLKMAEEWLQKEFPRTDIKANPHIQSKLIALKKNYNLLAKILD